MTLDRLRAGYTRVLEWIVIILMAILFIEVSLGVIYRTFGVALVWYDEVALDTSRIGCASCTGNSVSNHCWPSWRQRASLPVTCSATDYALILPMIAISGRNSAMTIVPTINARNTIMIGSKSDVSADTALSTSSS